MANTLLMANNGGSNVSTANTTEFWPCGGQVNKTTTETSVQLIFRTVGTLSNLQMNLSANSIAATSTIDLRVNAASSALTISPTSSQTGKLEDTTHTVSVSAGDKCNFRTVPGATTGTMTPQTMGISYDTGSTSVQKNASMNPAGKASTTASTATFWAISNNTAASTATETSSQALMKQAGTAQNMQVNVSANARTTATTFDLRKAVASTALTISYGSTVTGFLEDVTHTVAIAAADKINFRQLTGTGVQSLTVVAIGVDISNASGYGPLVIDTGGGSSQTAGTTRYNSIQGSMSLTTTETSAQYKVESAFVFSNMNVHIITNTASTLTYTLRNNVTASALTFVTTSATTGWFEDTTHTVTVAAADLLNIQTITAAGVVGWSTGVVYTQIVSGVNITKSLTETITISESPAVARLKGSIRTKTETITISSTPARLSTKTRALPTETVAISSTVVRIKGKVKTLTETITISTASLTILRNKIRTATETITISSPVARLAAKNRALATQTVTISEALARVKGSIRTISQTVTISEALVRLAAKIRTRTETVTISSTVTRIKGSIRTLTQTITVSDAVTRTVARSISKALTETVTISTASLTRLTAKIRTNTETVTISSTPARLSTKIRSLTSTVTISSTVVRIKGAVKALTETVTISSTVARLAAKIRTLTQTIIITDGVTRAKSGAQNIIRTLTETITISSTVNRLGAKIRPLTDTISTTSSLSRLAAKNRAPPTESVTIGAGTATRVRGKVRSLTDTLSAISTLTRLSKKIRQIQETITIQDQVTRTPPGVQPKQPPRPSQTVLAQELRHLTTLSKDLQRFLLETVHIQDRVKIDVKRYSKVIRTSKVKKIVRILDLVKLVDDIYNKRG